MEAVLAALKLATRWLSLIGFYSNEYRIGGTGRISTEEVREFCIHQIVARTRGNKRSDGFPLYIAVFNHEIIAGHKIFVKVVKDASDVVVRIFDDEPWMRCKA
jgi:hypothetical protein